jgi:hypothetical protein
LCAACRGSFEPVTAQQQQSTLTYRGGVAPATFLPLTAVLLHAVLWPCTTGERSDVLSGLGPISPSAHSSSTPRSPTLDAYKTQHADKEKHDYQW